MIDINKKYKTRSGCEVRIYATDGDSKFPIHGAILRDAGWCHFAWLKDGKHSNLIHNHDMDLIEVSPYEDFKTDDKVLAWYKNGKKYRRYFAGLNDEGKPMTFPDGVTSWSTRDWDKEVWGHCEKVCDE